MLMRLVLAPKAALVEKDEEDEGGAALSKGVIQIENTVNRTFA